MSSIPGRRCLSVAATGRAVLLLSAAAVALSACTATTNVRGYVPQQTDIAQIKPGVDNRQSVAGTLGTPSTADPFRDRTWYYISRTTESFAFFEDRVVDQSVVAVDFDDAGTVTDIRHFTMEDARQIAMNADATPTRGKELTFFGQLFGNLGRFGGVGGEGDGDGPGS